MSNGIKISPKYGANPSIEVCPICGTEIGLVLLGKLPNDEEAPKTIKGQLCDNCAKKYVRILEVVGNNEEYKYTGRNIIVERKAINIAINCPYAIMLEEEFNQLLERINKSKWKLK